MMTMNRRRGHTVICGVFTVIAAALITAWYLLSDLDTSTRAAQLGAMIAVVAAVSTASAARSRRQRSFQDDAKGATPAAAKSRQ